MTAPINMILFCPKCGTQHVDEIRGEWTNPPHRSHLCAQCGTVWRPADVATNGVAVIQTNGLCDTWIPGVATAPAVRFCPNPYCECDDECKQGLVKPATAEEAKRAVDQALRTYQESFL